MDPVWIVIAISLASLALLADVDRQRPPQRRLPKARRRLRRNWPWI